MTNKETVEILMERIARLKENYNANAKSDKELLVGKFVTESGDVMAVYGPEQIVTDMLESYMDANPDEELTHVTTVTKSGDEYNVMATVYGPEYVVTDLLEYHGALANKEQFDSQKFLESITDAELNKNLNKLLIVRIF